ncbi:hypothetical protein [Lewinella sp. IMCC34191]|uniref:hypothetical protein n=1 Tax=Lewinella sp. IMCC34191 TaxID=2259172 RepID=UPI000E270AB5|nr:hypothetical protein [Lewinella sp. IMCC34191]
MENILVVELLDLVAHETFPFELDQAKSLPDHTYFRFDSGAEPIAQYGLSTVRARVLRGDVYGAEALACVEGYTDRVYLEKVVPREDGTFDLTLDSKLIFSHGYTSSITALLIPGTYLISTDACGAQVRWPDFQRRLWELLVEYSTLPEKDYFKGLLRPGYQLMCTKNDSSRPGSRSINIHFRHDKGIDGMLDLSAFHTGYRYLQFFIPENNHEWPLRDSVRIHQTDPTDRFVGHYHTLTHEVGELMATPSAVHSLIEVKADLVDTEVYEGVRDHYDDLIARHSPRHNSHSFTLTIGGYPREVQQCIGFDLEGLTKPYTEIRYEDAQAWRFIGQISEALFYQFAELPIKPDGEFYFFYHPESPDKILIAYQHS